MLELYALSFRSYFNSVQFHTNATWPKSDVPPRWYVVRRTHKSYPDADDIQLLSQRE